MHKICRNIFKLYISILNNTKHTLRIYIKIHKNLKYTKRHQCFIQNILRAYAKPYKNTKTKTQNIKSKKYKTYRI